MGPMARRVVFIISVLLMLALVFFLVIFAFLFLFPGDFFLFNLGGVNVRNTYTRYTGSDVERVLSSRNLIIQSYSTNIEVRMRRPGQEDEGNQGGTIVIFENARGISTNLLNRTHVDWMQIVHPVTGQVYYKIRVHEPTGAIVNRNARVTINLKETTDVFNFRIETGVANVTFSGDPLVNEMNIDTIILDTVGGNVTLPNAPTVVNPFEMNIENLIVNSTTTNLVGRSHIENVEITRGVGQFTFGTLGSLETRAAQSNIRFDEIHENAEFHASTGSLQGGEIWGNLMLRSSAATTNIRQVRGNVDIQTTTGAQWFTDIQGNLDFTSTGTGSMAVRRVGGITNVSAHRGNLNIGSGGGSGVIQGARNNVTVTNRYGHTVVFFALDLTSAPVLNVTGQHGNVTASNIRGPVEIRMGRYGDALARGVVTAEFTRVFGTTNIIHHFGSTNWQTNFGRVNVVLQHQGTNTFHGFNLAVERSWDSRDFTGWPNTLGSGNSRDGVLFHNSAGGTNWPVQGGGAPLLTVSTSNSVRLTARR